MHVSASNDVEPSPVAGRLWVVLAAVMWSSSGLFAKSRIFDDWPLESRGLLLAFSRAAFAGLLVLPAVRQPRWSPKLVPMALAFAAMNVTYLSAMTLTTAANAIWLQSTAPWWVFLFGVVVMRDSFSRIECIPLILGGLGIATILWHEIHSSVPIGVACGLAAGMTYALVVLSMRALRGFNSAWLVVVNHLATAGLLLPYVLYRNIWPTPWQLAVLAAFGFFQMGLPYLFFARGLRSISSQEASFIGLLEPVLLPIWVYWKWDEEPAQWTMVGAGLILAGLVLRYVAARAITKSRA